MAVYERSYKRYAGETTPLGLRWSVVTRYAFRDVFKSRLLVAFFVFCYVQPLGLGVIIYLRQSLSFLEAYQIPLDRIFPIDADRFFQFLVTQGWLSFFLVVFVGPGLVSRDLVNNALPLYLSRPFSRVEYVFGKATVLAALLSAVTWVPGLLLWSLHAGLVGGSWWRENLRLAVALFVGSWLWIALLAFFALALSAWVRWRAVAGFGMLGLVFAAIFMSAMINQLFDTQWGNVLVLPWVTWNVWGSLFGTEVSDALPLWAAWVSLGFFTAGCLFVLDRKLRAYEVVS